uniref:Sigma-54 factor interaction domain-containing protein n=1 Tax=Escherichia coli TaxID=562 RepID=A0A1U9XF82_ECOLX|nr:hypothetical protein 23-3_00045 [Escherichia coli]
MRIKHSNMINMNMNMNMNMMKEAIDVLINSEKHILIIGETGTGKSTLLAELLINDTDVKYFDFCDIYKRHEHLPLLKHHYLCDENFDYFDFLSAPEKTLVLNSVAIGNNLRESKVVQMANVYCCHDSFRSYCCHDSFRWRRADTKPFRHSYIVNPLSR